MAALLTDGIRAKLLENAGYETQILEFIDMEHTPKNLLIRAVKRQEGSKKTAGRTESVHGSVPCEADTGRSPHRKGGAVMNKRAARILILFSCFLPHQSVCSHT